MATATQHPELSTDYKLSDEAIRSFRANGYIKLKQVLSPEVLDYYGREITDWVHKLNRNTKPMAERTTYAKAFIQVGNIWTHSEVAKELCLSRRLGKIAADLMGVSGVRMYHDQALYKESSGGFTPWHADQFYWPLETNNTCTIWIPLQHTPLEMGPLSFAAASHKHDIGRHLNISDESEKQIAAALEGKKLAYDEGPFELGEVSYHSGWTFHRAGPNKSQRSRSVMTIIYMEDGIRAATPKNSAQASDLQTWLRGCQPGDMAASPLNPVIYRAGAQ